MSSFAIGPRRSAALSLLLAAGAASSPAAHAAKLPAVESIVEMAPVIQNRFVTCRDGTYSALVEGRAVWTFNDTCMTSGGDAGQGFIDNTLSASTSLDASSGITLNLDKHDTQGVPVRFVPFTANELAINAKHAPQGNGIALWPGHLVDDPARHRELIFFGAVYRGGSIGFNSIGSGIAVADPTFTTVTRPVQNPDPDAREPSYLWNAGEQSYTGGYVKVGEMLYCYGAHGIFLTNHLRVARVPLADALDKSKWTYWNGTEWSTRNANQATVYIGGAAGDNIFWDDYLGEFVTVYMPYAQNNAYFRVADHPEGPWSKERFLFTAQQGTDPSYAVRVHTEYAEGGGKTQYVSYVKNTGFFAQSLELVKVTFGPTPK